MRTNLTVRYGGQDRTYEGPSVRIGSAGHNDFRISTPAVLPEHVLVVRNGDKWKVERQGGPRTL